MLVQLAELAVVAWLPGAVLYRAPWFDRDRRAACSADERGFWQVVLSVLLTLLSVLLLGAFGLYRFEYLLALLLGIALLPVLWWRGRLRYGSPAPRPAVAALIPLALVVLCGARFLPASEYVLGGKDPGTYVNEGVHIAQRGSLTIADPVVESIPASFRGLFFPSHERADYYSVRFMGFFLQDPDRGTVVGQFPHLFPAALAVGYGLDGLTGVRRTTPVVATLGVLAVYFTAAALFGRLVGAAAATLLALNVITVWFAKYPNSEVMMQAFLFASMLALMRAQEHDSRFFAATAGLLLGAQFFLRYDIVLAIGAITTGLLLGVLAGRRLQAAFFAAMVLLALIAVPYLIGPMRAYVAYPIAFVGNMPVWQHAALLTAGAALLAAVTMAARVPLVTRSVAQWVPLLFAVAVALAAVYGLFLRHPAGRLAAADAYALRTYANWYVTVPVVLAAVIGYVIYARVAFWRAPFFYVLAAVFGIFFFYKLRIVHEYFWAARRFVPVILPMTMTLAAAAAVGGRGSGSSPMRLARLALGLTFLAVVGTQYVRASAPVVDHVEFADVIPRLEALASRIGERDLLIVESRDAGADTHVVALPLAYIYARNVLVLNSARPDRGSFAAFVGWARGRYERVLFLGGAGTDLVSRSFTATPVWSDRFEVPEYESVVNGYPRGPRNRKFDHSLYELVPSAAPVIDNDIDIGADDDLRVIRFQAKEQAGDRSFRWTTERSVITLEAIAPAARELTLVMADGGRPPGAPPATVMVSLGEWPLGTIEVDGPFAPYVLPIPAEVVERLAREESPVELRLRSTLWNPAKVLGSGDDRELGVMVDRVTIR